MAQFYAQLQYEYIKYPCIKITFPYYNTVLPRLVRRRTIKLMSFFDKKDH